MHHDTDTANLTTLRDAEGHTVAALFWRDGQAYIDLRETCRMLALPYRATVRSTAARWADGMRDAHVVRGSKAVATVGLLPMYFDAWLLQPWARHPRLEALRAGWAGMWAGYCGRVGASPGGLLVGGVKGVVAEQLLASAQARAAHARRAAAARWAGHAKVERNPRPRAVTVQSIQLAHKLIKVHGLSLTKAAKAAGMSPATLCLIRANKYPLTSPALKTAWKSTFGRP